MALTRLRKSLLIADKTPANSDHAVKNTHISNMYSGICSQYISGLNPKITNSAREIAQSRK